MNPARSKPTALLPADEAGLAAAAAELRAGAVVAFPTETVYGLGADATDGAAVAAIYAAKARPRFNPLIAHLADRESAIAEGIFDARALALADAFWPGPLTLVVPRAQGGSVCDLARAGLETVALRVPAHPLARALILAAGRPIAAPSANRSGHVSPTTAEHVAADLDGRIAAIVDGGPTTVGLESTIVACLPGEPARLLRPGGIPRAEIEGVLGYGLEEAGAETARPQSPGLLASHYAPSAPVRLDAVRIEDGEAGLLFGTGSLDVGPGACALDLSPSRDLAEAAAGLFAALRRLDAERPRAIAVAPIPAEGLGGAILDRLRRAAAPRSAGNARTAGTRPSTGS